MPDEIPRVKRYEAAGRYESDGGYLKEDPHGEAVCFDDLGFTPADLVLLRRQAEYVRDLPYGDHGRNAWDVLADKIAALLPPSDG